MTYSAVIVAGGAARRLGGVSKPLIDINGTNLIQYALNAARRATQTVVVGPITVHHPASLTTSEEPPGGGPVAGLAAGLARVDPAPSWVLVLACDTPRAERAVHGLEAAARDCPAGTDGVWMTDPRGREQPLLALYRAAALHSAIASLDTVVGTSMRALTSALAMAAVPDPMNLSHDADTWEDVETLRKEML